jgi:hypothetical protein
MTDAEKAAWRAGAEAMRKAAAGYASKVADLHETAAYNARYAREAAADHDYRLLAEGADLLASAIRAAPLPEPGALASAEGGGAP